MKIEKLSNNKLKVIFSINELEKENIDYHAFMAGSTRCENMISSLLYIAKDELDFDTKNCNIEIETFEINHGNFILTITKFEKSNRLIAKRKQGNVRNSTCIYEFDSQSSYYNFMYFLKTNFSKLLEKFEKNHEFKRFSNKYILLIDGFEFTESDITIFNTSITEFATFKSNSPALVLKIKEQN